MSSTDSDARLRSARKILEGSVISYRGRPVGTSAATDPRFAAAFNYRECFVRDFVVSGLVFLADDQPQIVTSFLRSVNSICSQGQEMRGFDLHPGVMPASFRVEDDNGEERLKADFGDRAIGRVAPVDSMMWWVILLDLHRIATGDEELVSSSEVQNRLEQILDLCLKASFEVFPTLLVPDGCCMVDRRMGMYGHPLEIQALFHALLSKAPALLQPGDGSAALLERAATRERALSTYVRKRYWLDAARLTEIHRYRTEQFGSTGVNALNIHADSLPRWVVDWLADGGGYLVGNLGPGRIDFRFFALGNLLAVLFGLATTDQAEALFDLYEKRWDDLVGTAPLKLCFPAAEEAEWRLLTGSDPKNRPWSYHNAGSWPVLLWAFVAAALKVGRRELADRAYGGFVARCPKERWPEYYDGRDGSLVGRFANLEQVWTAAALLASRQLLDRPELLRWFPGPGEG